MKFLSPLLCVLLCCVAACDKTEPKPSKTEQVKVNLPPSPPMIEPTVAEKHTDGSYTVAGLIRGRKKLLRKNVTVKAHVLSVQKCPDSEECTKPEHAVLVDDPVKPHKRLIVVGGERTVFETLEPNQVVSLKGQYLQTDPRGFFILTEGLLFLEKRPEEDLENDALD